MLEKINEKGSLKDTPVMKLLSTMFEQDFSGIFYIKNVDLLKVLYFTRGRLVWVSSNSEEDKIENVLLAKKQVPAEIVTELKSKVKESDSIGKLLVEKGLITVEELVDTYKNQAKQIVLSILSWADGSYQLADAPPPEGVFNLDLSIIGFIIDYIAQELDIMGIWAEIKSLDAEMIKTTDQMKVAKYHLSGKQLQLLNSFDGKTSRESILTTTNGQLKEASLKLVYFFFMADLLIKKEAAADDESDLSFLEGEDDLGFFESTTNSPGTAPIELELDDIADSVDAALNDPLAPAASVDSEDSFEPVEHVGHVDSVDSVDSEEPVEPIEPVEPVEPVEHVGHVDSVDSEEPVEPIEPIEPVDSVDSEEPVEPVESTPYETGEPIEPIEPGKPGEPDINIEWEEITGTVETTPEETGEPEPEPEPAPAPAPAEAEVEVEVEAAVVDEAVPVEIPEPLEEEDMSSMEPPTPGDIETATGPEAVSYDYYGDGEDTAPGKLKVEADNIEDMIMQSTDDKPLPPPIEKAKKPLKVGRKKEKSRSKFILIALFIIVVIGAVVYLYVLPQLEGGGLEDIVVKKPAKKTAVRVKKKRPPTPEQEPGNADGKKIEDIKVEKVQPQITGTSKGKEKASVQIPKQRQKPKPVRKPPAQKKSKTAAKYFKEGNFIAAGNEWKKKMKQAGVRYSILLELDCMKESVRNAYKQVRRKDNFFILNRQKGQRNCFLVLWGTFSSRQEAAAAIDSLPRYFLAQKSPPSVIDLNIYL